MRYMVLFDVGDGIRAFQCGSRLRNGGIVVDST